LAGSAAKTVGADRQKCRRVSICNIVAPGRRKLGFERVQFSLDGSPGQAQNLNMFNLSRAQWSLIFLILAVTAGSLAYRLIISHRLVQTSLLFIGMPAIIAIFLAMTPKAQTAKGAIVKGITLTLLISGP